MIAAGILAIVLLSKSVDKWRSEHTGMHGWLVRVLPLSRRQKSSLENFDQGLSPGMTAGHRSQSRAVEDRWRRVGAARRSVRAAGSTLQLRRPKMLASLEQPGVATAAKESSPGLSKLRRPEPSVP